ncbi:MAG: hypothetical protein GWN87_05640, partial [Desulfuromonadales bacterium]|nr:hypothetical protein [Desulfuromonadales bacterium]
TEPDIVIIDEAPRYGTLAERIRALRQQHDHVAVFVAAKEQKPDEI